MWVKKSMKSKYSIYILLHIAIIVMWSFFYKFNFFFDFFYSNIFYFDYVCVETNALFKKIFKYSLNLNDSLNFYKNCCFSGWHHDESIVNTKNTKKWVFQVWVGKWRQLFLINFFEKKIWQIFFDLKNRQFFDFLKIFKKNIEFFRTSFRRRVALGFLLNFHENFIKKKL
jgi:hypothetical protein